MTAQHINYIFPPKRDLGAPTGMFWEVQELSLHESRSAGQEAAPINEFQKIILGDPTWAFWECFPWPMKDAKVDRSEWGTDDRVMAESGL